MFVISSYTKLCGARGASWLKTGLQAGDVFERRTATGSELFSLLTSLHTAIAKYLFTNTDDELKNLGDTTVLACEMFTSGCRPRLKNVAC